MGWSTELFTRIHFNKKTYNYKDEVESNLEKTRDCIKLCWKNIKNLTSVAKVKKLLAAGNPNYTVEELKSQFSEIDTELEDTKEELEEYYYDEFALSLLLEHWDECHDKDGYPIEPPDSIQWDTSYIWGDFLNTREQTEKEKIEKNQ